MTQEDILNDLIGRLGVHLHGASTHQEPYRGDIFELFKEAHNEGYFEGTSHPLLTGDAILVTLEKRWINLEGKEEAKKRRDVAHKVLTMWDDWRYAWDNHP
jgi:hypothetical protein